MFGGKYGKVMIIAMINIVAVFFVYNNLATEPGKLEQKHSSENHVNNQDVKIIYKQELQTKQLSTKRKSSTTIDPSDSKQYDQVVSETVISSNSSLVNSMKNLLSIKIHAEKVNKSSVDSHTFQDEELQQKLLDSSEIDLSPPNPVIRSTKVKIVDQVLKPIFFSPNNSKPSSFRTVSTM